MTISIRVLGPIRVVDADGGAIAVGSQRRRELLGRLVAAGGRVVSVRLLVDDLWDDPPAGADGAVRTFISELRRALEPDRSPRTPSRLIETVGTGYALRIPRAHVDAHLFEDTLRSARDAPTEKAVSALSEALSWWRGEAFADLDDSGWVRRERARLTEIHLQAIEHHARAMLDLGRGSVLIPDLAAYAESHPWREQAWILFSHALYQADRQVDALASLREARTRLRDHFALESTTNLDRLEQDILHHSPELIPASRGDDNLRLLTRTEATGTYTRLRSMSTVAKAAALTGGSNLIRAQAQRAAAAVEAERTGDPHLAARVIAAYDVPTIWTRSDDTDQSEILVATTRRTLHRLGPDAPPALRARLLATIGIEHRGSRDAWAAEAAIEAERLARDPHDPQALAFALNARFVQSFQQPGNTDPREDLAAEIIDLSVRHDLPAFEILGHLITIQVHSARGDFDSARQHVETVENLGTIHESPAVHILTAAFRAMVLAAQSSDPADAAHAYRSVAVDLAGAGMPGLATGLFPLALLSLRLRHERPAPTDPDLDWGPYLPWVEPLRQNLAVARRAAQSLPDPPATHLYDVLWAITAHAAIRLNDRALAERAHHALTPLRGEIAGGTTAMLTFGPVNAILADLEHAFAWPAAKSR